MQRWRRHDASSWEMPTGWKGGGDGGGPGGEHSVKRCIAPRGHLPASPKGHVDTWQASLLGWWDGFG